MGGRRLATRKRLLVAVVPAVFSLAVDAYSMCQVIDVSLSIGECPFVRWRGLLRMIVSPSWEVSNATFQSL